MIDRSVLTPALTAVVSSLVDDLRVRADSVDEVRLVVESEWRAASEAGRTAHDVETWREDLLAQVAVSWVLGCVFIRFCEDNGLVSEPLLSGRGDWARWANDAQVQYFREHPDEGERGYLTHVFTVASEMNGLSDVFGKHNPVWRFGPSDDACRELIGLWRESDPDTGGLVWDFADPEWDTRFLGDLYQDLSEYAKKTYALLQTPDFVESFILDRTLDPAIEEFGLDGGDGSGFRVIDPACGSGHFLLGSFARLAERHLEKSPGSGRRAAAAEALESVFGVDLNPSAASIARFRLLVAALRFAEVPTLAEAPVFTINVAVGDSLLHGPQPGRLDGVLESVDRQAAETAHLYATEDSETVGRILGLKFHAVVANPPYITPKDPAASSAYRERYETCHRQYSLSVPFMERLFDLAIRGAGRPAGFVGQITANSFMKREFGKKLIQDYLASEIDLSHVIDTSGAYIPGHGTPTVILFGRNRYPVSAGVRGVLGIRGEPSTPEDPAQGLVWSSIEALVDQPGSENDYVSADDIERTKLSGHPWSLQGGAAAPLKELIEGEHGVLGETTGDIGRTTVVGEDDAWVLPVEAPVVRSLPRGQLQVFTTGTVVRDYAIDTDEVVFYPYDSLGGEPELEAVGERFLWPNRTLLSARTVFGKSVVERGEWFEHLEHYAARLKTPLSIAFAFVATHNHFVLDRGGKVFNRSAPVIKLAEDASVDDHLQLLGLLNSSVACFWMKQVFQKKTQAGGGGGSAGVEFTHQHEFDGTKLKQFPLVAQSVLELSTAIDHNAAALSDVLPGSLLSSSLPSVERWAAAEASTACLRAELVWLQEELDWRCMYLYGVTEEDLSFGPEVAFELAKGERAFEIALARRAESGEAETTWFERHDSTPITELPASWPAWYRERVERRLQLIESDRFVKLLERPEYKRRWNWESFDELSSDALAGWLLTRLEDARYWSSVEPRSVAELAADAQRDVEFMQVAEMYVGSAELDVAALITKLTKGDAVPFVAALRYKDSGLRKRASWEATWDLQRREDAGEDVGKIPVPPKYTSADFRSGDVWKLRGKLDVPKERFVSYPGMERAADDSAVLSWAGWDHLEQAQALAALFTQRVDGEDWDTERVVPLLAGLAELVPWLKQWHNEVDPSFGQGMGDFFADFLRGEMNARGLTDDDLAGWRPLQKTRGRKKKATT